MAFKSEKQKKFLEAAAHDPKFIKPGKIQSFSLPALPQAPHPDDVINPDKKFKLLRSKLKG